MNVMTFVINVVITVANIREKRMLFVVSLVNICALRGKILLLKVKFPSTFKP